MYGGEDWESAIPWYGESMATRKITITLPDQLIDALGDAAEQDGIPLSRLIAGAAETELRRRGARKVIQDWQTEHGAFTAGELAAARAEMAAADLELLHQLPTTPGSNPTDGPSGGPAGDARGRKRAA